MILLSTFTRYPVSILLLCAAFAVLYIGNILLDHFHHIRLRYFVNH